MLNEFQGPLVAAAMCKLSIYNTATDFLWLLLPGGCSDPMCWTEILVYIMNAFEMFLTFCSFVTISKASVLFILFCFNPGLVKVAMLNFCYFHAVNACISTTDYNKTVILKPQSYLAVALAESVFHQCRLPQSNGKALCSITSTQCSSG